MKPCLFPILQAAAGVLTANADPTTYDQSLSDHKVANRAEKSGTGRLWSQHTEGPQGFPACAELAGFSCAQHARHSSGQSTLRQTAVRRESGRAAGGRKSFGLGPESDHAPVVTAIVLEFDKPMAEIPTMAP